MRVFLSEYLTCGALIGEGAKLAREGAAMLRAFAADAARVPGWNVVAIWDAALEPFGVPGVEVMSVRTPEEEAELFRRLAAEADATLVIAPEFGGLLEERCRIVEHAGGRFAGSSAAAIALCGDKLALAEHLAERGVPTIPTRPCDFAAEIASGEGAVVKPRYGAGSVELFRVRTAEERASAEAAYAGERPFGEPIVQPYVRGITLSVSGIVSANGIELLPVGRQRIADDGRLHYEGGELPASTGHEAAVADVARRAIAAVPDLRGWVGVDLILPETDDGFGTPVVVEINPRLTTSYLGYRLLAEANLAERVVAPDMPGSKMTWRKDRVEFRANGEARFVARNV